MTSKAEKNRQLGMDAGTAYYRLKQDVIWSLLVRCGLEKCHVCGEDMCRDTFSIEHIKPWLHSDDPVKLFWDMNNISFSHLACNYGRRRRPQKSEKAKLEDARLHQKRLAREAFRKRFGVNFNENGWQQKVMLREDKR